MTALTDRTDPRWTPAQLEHLAEFESAPTPPEVREERVVEEVARAMYAVAHRDCTFPGCTFDGSDPDEYRRGAAAAVTAYRAAQDGGAEEAVRRELLFAADMLDRGATSDTLRARAAALATQADR